MSASSRPDKPAHDVDADTPAAPPGAADDDINAALDTELADHLAASAADLVRRGATEEAAAARAIAAFGDLAQIKRHCWWIQKGDEVMFRTIGIGLLGVLTAAVVIVAFGGWRVQRDLSSRTEQLSEQIATLTATQQEMLAQQRPPEITGVCYLGDRSHPATNVELQLGRFADLASGGSSLPRRRPVIMRRVRTDAEGRFSTGGIPEGDYCVFAPLQAEGQRETDSHPLFNMLQSRPLFVLTGGGSEVVNFDLQPQARIRIESDGTLPEAVTIGGYECRLFMNVAFYPLLTTYKEQDLDFPVAPSDAQASAQWPFPGNMGDQSGAVGAIHSPLSKLPIVESVPDYTYHVNVSVTMLPPGFWEVFINRKSPATEPAQGSSNAARKLQNSEFGMGTGGVEQPHLTPVNVTYSVDAPQLVSAGEQLTLRVGLIGKPLADRVPEMIDAAKEKPKTAQGGDMRSEEDRVVQRAMQLLARSMELDIQLSREKIAE